MDNLPNIENLSIGEKDQLIRELWSLVRDFSAQVTALQLKITELEARLAVNSRNSSKPPSSDGLVKPKPKSLRKRDRIVTHFPPSRCGACYRPLPEASVVESRQVFDLPPLRFEVTEHRVLAARCAYGKICRGDFPAGIFLPVQYGSAAMAAAVHLTHPHVMPVQRTAALMGDFFGLPMAEATVRAACEEARNRLQATVDSIGAALQLAEVVHANNLAEQAVRMPKVKQKISGCFRTRNGADTFCILRSCLDTVHKQGTNLFHALTLTSKGTPLSHASPESSHRQRLSSYGFLFFSPLVSQRNHGEEGRGRRLLPIRAQSH
jgi:transposase